MPGRAWTRTLSRCSYVAALMAAACEGEMTEPPTAEGETQQPAGTSDGTPPADAGETSQQGADVTDVEASGAAGSYTFSVTVQSPDTGCEQYANWWEVLDENGALIYRRILGHSHVGEQPFVRSGGPVPVEPDARVYVRAHLFPTGYGGAIWTGSVTDGFAVATDVPAGFGDGVSIETPDCAH